MKSSRSQKALFSGQRIQRVLVAEKVYEEFSDQLLQVSKKSELSSGFASQHPSVKETLKAIESLTSEECQINTVAEGQAFVFDLSFCHPLHQQDIAEGQQLDKVGQD